MRTGDLSQLDREIARLEGELASLHESRVKVLTAEINLSQERVNALGPKTSGPAARTMNTPATAKVATKKKSKTKAASKKRARAKVASEVDPSIATRTKAGKKRERMSTADVERKLIEAVRDGGSMGISLKDISVASGIKYPTAAKKLKEMTDVFEKRGALKDARYFLKNA